MSLELYNKKRDFRKTSEPQGNSASRSRDSGKLMFVVQKHDARNLHYDFRLEWDGALKSWAIPKGPSLSPDDKRLAVMVEDHPLDYADFEGVIPKGEYGAGTVLLWDRGEWEPEEGFDPAEGLEKGELKVQLKGEKLKGSWVLVKMKGRGENNWLLIKHKDKAASQAGKSVVERLPKSVESGRSLKEIAEGGNAYKTDLAEIAGAKARNAMPAEVHPQLATLADAVPQGPHWIHELKYDGYRILAYLDGESVRLISRNGKDWTSRFQHVADQLKNLSTQAVLDGEVVVLDDDGKSSFQALQQALKSKDKGRLVYFAFDLLWWKGQDLRGARLLDRKAALQQLLGAATDPGEGVLRFSDHIQGSGSEFFERVCEMQLEGVISKKGTSTYHGTRNRDWLKIKCIRRQEFVIAGYTEPSGSRTGFGALLLGVYDDQDRLIYAGRVGTGFKEQTLKDVYAQLKRLELKTSSFDVGPDGAEAKGAHWVKPELVAEVAFAEWTEEGRLRHPSFQGLRLDKDATEVRREAPPAREEEAPSSKERKPPKSRAKAEMKVGGITITHEDRIVFPDAEITKGEVALYYEKVADEILKHIADRPLSVVRCPEGRQKQCFYQKHHSPGMPKAIREVRVREDKDTADYMMVDSADGVLALVQFGALEIHPWLSRRDKLDRPDTLIFDLDPDEAVPWEEVLGAAFLLRDELARFDLESFPKLTGGKGIHVVVPIVRRHGFEVVKPLSKAFAERVRDQNAAKFVTTASKTKRSGKIFVDYLRNGRGATAVAPFSTRARSGAAVATPVSWDELRPGVQSDQYTIKTLPRRLASLKRDPWENYFQLRQSLTKGMLTDLGVKV